MTAYIALLRAVNVGGTGKLPMSDFRKLLEELGFSRVETYIQSGNAVFDAACPPHEATRAVETGLQKILGKPVGVLLRTHEQLDRLIAANPFAVEAAANGTRVFAAFLSAVPAPSVLAGLAKIPVRNERYHLAGDTLLLHLPDGPVDTKFQAKMLDRILGVTSTARNWNTVLKLHAMSLR